MTKLDDAMNEMVKAIDRLSKGHRAGVKDAPQGLYLCMSCDFYHWVGSELFAHQKATGHGPA